MRKLLSVAFLVVTFAFVVFTSVSAQTSTPTTTASPTPTTMPAGAPSTGYGTM